MVVDWRSVRVELQAVQETLVEAVEIVTLNQVQWTAAISNNTPCSHQALGEGSFRKQMCESSHIGGGHKVFHTLFSF